MVAATGQRIGGIRNDHRKPGPRGTVFFERSRKRDRVNKAKLHLPRDRPSLESTHRAVRPSGRIRDDRSLGRQTYPSGEAVP